MVVFDATILMLALRPNALVRHDPSTGKRVHRPGDRIAYLIDKLDEKNEKITIPTPALSEILVRADDRAEDLLRQIDRYSVFRPTPFDTRAAVEAARIQRHDLTKNAKANRTKETFAKLKYDRQIIAIAKVENAWTIYSDDDGLKTLSERNGIQCYSVYDLELPPDEGQGSFDF